MDVGIEHDFLSNPLMTAIKLARYKFVYRLLDKDDTVLDLGCGYGYSSYFFSKACKYVRGVDLIIKPDVMQKKFLTASNISFVQGDLMTYNDDNLYSVIVMLDVIEHFSMTDGEAVIARYLKNLAPSGLIIIGTPNKYSEAYRSHGGKDAHLYEYTPDELRCMLKKYFSRVILFSMNDEVVHTGFDKLAWYLFAVCSCKKDGEYF